MLNAFMARPDLQFQINQPDQSVNQTRPVSSESIRSFCTFVS